MPNGGKIKRGDPDTVLSVPMNGNQVYVSNLKSNVSGARTNLTHN
jgi:hypothetical protein